MSDLRARVLEFVKLTVLTTFAELEKEFPEHFNHPDNQALMLQAHVFLWGCMSHEMADLLRELKNEEVLHIYGVSVLAYLLFGNVFDSPLAELDKEYNDGIDRWFPIVWTMPK